MNGERQKKATREVHVCVCFLSFFLLPSLSLTVISSTSLENPRFFSFFFPQKLTLQGSNTCKQQPGLNALANHGYISRNGIATLLGVVPTLNQVFGVSVELGLILAVMGTVWTGNPLSLSPSFSIGGNDTDVQNLLGNVLGLLGA